MKPKPIRKTLITPTAAAVALLLLPVSLSAYDTNRWAQVQQWLKETNARIQQTRSNMMLTNQIRAAERAAFQASNFNRFGTNWERVVYAERFVVHEAPPADRTSLGKMQVNSSLLSDSNKFNFIMRGQRQGISNLFKNDPVTRSNLIAELNEQIRTNGFLVVTDSVSVIQQ